MLLRRGDRALWWFEERFWWADDDLHGGDVLALVRERERRGRRRLERAHAALAGEERPRRRDVVPRPVRQAVWERDGGRCVQCGADFELQFDHVIPVALGGASTRREPAGAVRAVQPREGRRAGLTPRRLLVRSSGGDNHNQRRGAGESRMATIGLLHPGEMGAAVGAALAGAGHEVLWASEGRSAASAQRAAAAGLIDAGDVAGVLARAEVVLSIVPPHAARDDGGGGARLRGRLGRRQRDRPGDGARRGRRPCRATSTAGSSARRPRAPARRACTCRATARDRSPRCAPAPRWRPSTWALTRPRPAR